MGPEVQPSFQKLCWSFANCKLYKKQLMLSATWGFIRMPDFIYLCEIFPPMDFLGHFSSTSQLSFTIQQILTDQHEGQHMLPLKRVKSANCVFSWWITRKCVTLVGTRCPPSSAYTSSQTWLISLWQTWKGGACHFSHSRFCFLVTLGVSSCDFVRLEGFSVSCFF